MLAANGDAAPLADKTARVTAFTPRQNSLPARRAAIPGAMHASTSLRSTTW
jgi:hypothetical protein